MGHTVTSLTLHVHSCADENKTNNIHSPICTLCIYVCVC